MKCKITTFVICCALLAFAHPQESNAQNAKECVEITTWPKRAESGKILIAPVGLRNKCNEKITAIYCWRIKEGYRSVHEYGCGDRVGIYYTHRLLILPGDTGELEYPSGVPLDGIETIAGKACFGSHGHTEYNPDFPALHEAFNEILVKKDGTVICPEPK